MCIQRRVSVILDVIHSICIAYDRVYTSHLYCCKGVVRQYYIGGKYDPQNSKLPACAVPNFAHNGVSSSSWLRLVDFAEHADAVHLFDEFSCH